MMIEQRMTAVLPPLPPATGTLRHVPNALFAATVLLTLAAIPLALRTSDAVLAATALMQTAVLAVGSLFMRHEIRRRAQAMRSLRAREALLRATFEQSAVGIAHVGTNGRILRANRRLAQLLGRPLEALAGVLVPDLSHPQDREALDAGRQRLYAGAVAACTVDKRYLDGDGLPVWMRTTVSLVRNAAGKPEYEIAVFEDISVEHRAAADLRRFRAALDTSAAAVYITPRSAMRFADVNEVACRMLGYRREELIGTESNIVFGGDAMSVAQLAEIFDRVIASPQALPPVRTLHRRKDGSRVPVEVHRSAVTIDGEQFVVGLAHEVSARQATEQALRDSEERYRGLVELSPDAVYVVQDSRLAFANPAAARLFGAAGPGDLVGRQASDLTHPQSRALTAERLQAIDAGAAANPRAEQLFLRTDGMPVPVEVESARLVLGGAPAALVIARDISERKQAERLLRMEHAITRCLADADSASVGLKAALRIICETNDWEAGRYFSVDQTAGLLRFNECWSVSDAAYEAFARDSQGLTFASGAGLAGRVWQSGEPIWAPDIRADARVLNPALASLSGIRSMLVFPIDSQGTTIGVVAAFSRQVRKPDERLLQAVRVIGSQLGQFLQRKRAEAGLQRFRSALDMSLDAVYIVSRSSLRIVDVNDGACRMLGYRREELIGADPRVMSANKSLTAENLSALYDGVIGGAPGSESVTTVHCRKDGTPLPVEVHHGGLSIDGEQYVVTLARDQSARRAAKRRLRESEERYRKLVELSPDAIFIIQEGRVALANDAAARLFGAPDPRSMIGVPIAEHVHPESGSLLEQRLRAFDEGAAVQPRVEQTFLRPDGTAVTVEVMSTRFTHAGALAVLAVARDVSERKRIELELVKLAHFDSVTGLPNRALFRDRLEQALAQAGRNAWQVGLLFIDLDQFKWVNDSLGHPAGDELLREIGTRLHTCLRSGDTVARLGGDEFAVILPDLESPDAARVVAQKMLAAIGAPLMLGAQEIYVSASIGITVYPPDAADADTLVRYADVAMYRAKSAGRNGYQFFTPEMNAEAGRRLALEKDLRRAIERGEFELHYQPKADVTASRVTGVEALLRWRRADGTLVAPAEFVPVLEDTGLIAPVGDWVIQTACAQLAAWDRAGTCVPVAAVNVSARQFRGGELVASVRKALADSGCAPQRLELEITESLMMHDVDVTAETLDTLRAIGVRVAVDDFGTGHSSLAYLKRLPIDVLKIDRSFIKDLSEDANDAAIATAIIAMAHTLGYHVVAEGVETPLQRQFLEAYGCDEIQGYLLSRPLPAHALAAWIAARAQSSTGANRDAGAGMQSHV